MMARWRSASGVALLLALLVGMLVVLDAPRTTTLARQAAREGFVGSTTCAQCHAGQFAAW